MYPLYAHTKPGSIQSDWQKLDEHLGNVAGLARLFAASFNAAEWGECAGWLHDPGKALPDFQTYLNKGAQGKASRGSVPHSIYGARLAVELHPVLGKLLAYAIAGHHGGLPDWGALERRLREGGVPPEVAALAAEASGPRGFPFRDFGGNRPGFVLSFFTRMVFSCLVDADWLDTEAFLDPQRAGWRKGYPPLDELARRFFPRLEALASAAKPTEVNRIRAEVLDACQAAAELPPGLFSLTVPTGGGKTLSSLAFALRHAQAHGLDRVVYVIPFTSIIEQNADVFREFLGSDALVEHHSSVDYEDEGESVRPELRRAKLASENWDAPVIATTAVQFFESLFAAKPSRCRKLHNLARSVIILDEAQMLPRDLLLPCLDAIRELASHYGATVVLCTATQPAVGEREDFDKGLAGVREIIPDPPELHDRLRRVTVEDLGTLENDALIGRLRGHAQVLCIVNTRAHARELWEKLCGAEGLVHLSANMTAQHRSEKLDEVRDALADGRPCLVVSTSLVEAGVDVDFPAVYRAAAGLDSVAQAAGRCDREGRLSAAAGAPAGRVFLFRPADGLPPGHFTVTANTAAEVLRQGHADPLSPAAMERYFRLLFWQAGPELDKKDVLRLLEEGAREFNFPFKQVAGLYRIIQDYTQPVIVPRDDETRSLVRELEHADSPARVLRKLQRNIVQVKPRVWRGLVEVGAARVVLEGLAVLENMDIYDDKVGLRPEEPEFMNIESTIT